MKTSNIVVDKETNKKLGIAVANTGSRGEFRRVSVQPLSFLLEEVNARSLPLPRLSFTWCFLLSLHLAHDRVVTHKQCFLRTGM